MRKVGAKERKCPSPQNKQTLPVFPLNYRIIEHFRLLVWNPWHPADSVCWNMSRTGITSTNEASRCGQLTAHIEDNAQPNLLDIKMVVCWLPQTLSTNWQKSLELDLGFKKTILCNIPSKKCRSIQAETKQQKVLKSLDIRWQSVRRATN